MRGLIIIFACLLSTNALAFATANTRSYADVVADLEKLANQYPENATMFDLGWSDNGVPIKALAIGNGEIENLVVGTHHGNEYGSTAVTEAFAADLAANPIEGQTLYVVPVLNTSGYDRRRRNESNGKSYHDPNRDYPGPCTKDIAFQLSSTKALADFLDDTNVVTSATLHTYYPGALYPWGLSTFDLDTGYTDTFIQLGKDATFLSGYKVGNSTEELYPADGTFEDYAYWKHGIWSMLMEMGHTHYPSESQVKEMIRVNVPGLRKMFANAPTLRAPDFAFKGKCNNLSWLLDLKNE